MEIERKYLIDGTLPFSLEPFSCHLIEQAYLCTAPVVRVRRQDQDYILTYKGSGLMAREEYNLPLTATSYAHLLTKADGNIITKKRYVIPLAGGLRAELDLFEGTFDGLRIVEVEAPDRKRCQCLYRTRVVWGRGHIFLCVSQFHTLLAHNCTRSDMAGSCSLSPLIL